MTVERPLGRDQGRDLDIYQIFGRIQGKSVARSCRGEKLGMGLGVGNWDWGLEVGIWIGDWGLGLGLGLEIGIGD